MTKKMSLTEVKLLPPFLLLRLIKKAKNKLKKDNVMLSIFKQYKLDINEIDYIPVYFKDLNCSAKCEHAIVYLNWNLLRDGFDIKDTSYLIHEFTHFCQQTTGINPTKSSNDGNYLENPCEQEAFQNQIEYIDERFGEDEAEKYVDKLLDHHDVKGEEKEDLEDVLMEKI